jgi:lysophospholipase L1-like esterase
MLSAQTVYQVFDYPKTGEKKTIAQACAAEKPNYLVLSFGQNGLVNFASDKSSYVNNYKKLIDAVRTASPETKIILQTVYPVRAQGNYSVDVPTLNQYINTLNGWLPEIASAYDNVCVADTASVLIDVDGVLAQSFDQGDGQHLTVAAYQAILDYLRTHAWQTPEL